MWQAFSANRSFKAGLGETGGELILPNAAERIVRLVTAAESGYR